MRLRVLVLLLALVAGLEAVSTPVRAEPTPTRVADACESAVEPRKDLSSATFGFNAEAFQVAAESCALIERSHGTWLVTFHLVSFSPEVQISGLLQNDDENPKVAETWSGFRFCAEAACPLVSNDHSPYAGFVVPSGSELQDTGFGYAWGGAVSTVSPRQPFANGSWARHLPAGTAVPDRIDWWAEVRTSDSGQPGTFMTVDRVPDTGTASSQVLPPGRPTVLTVVPGVPSTYGVQGDGALRADEGTLRSDGSGGPGLPGRAVSVTAGQTESWQVTDSGGRWVTDYYEPRNQTARAYFEGDGVNAGAVTDPYHAYLRAFVSLDLRDGVTLARNQPVDLRGVVRPRGTGDVEVLVKRAGTGDAWTVLRRTNLVAGRTDTYYRVSWTPRVRGRYVLVTRWLHGTTADGGVLNGQSEYRRVTVSG